MAFKKNAQNSAPKSARAPQARQVITLETATALAPSHVHAEKMSAAFALDPVDFDGIRKATEEQMALSVEALQSHVNDTAMRIHLQRIVGAYVSSAYGAGQFYSTKITAARELTTKLNAEYRDEDRDGVLGFETRAARAREFAAQSGLTAYALLAVATGAIHAYAEITGETWKPYEAPIAPSRSVSREAAAAELEALGG